MWKKTFRPVCASSGSIHDLIDVIQTKIDNIGGSTKIQASDYDPVFRDPNGVFGLAPDETITYSEIEEYWDENHDDDPSLEQYTSFQEWWNDTSEWLEEVDDVEGCDMPIQGSSGSIHDMINDIQDKLDEVNSSTTVEGANGSDKIGEEYIQKLMDSVVKKMRLGPKSEYEVDDQQGNIILTSVSDDGVIIEYNIPIADLGGNLNEDVEYIGKSIKEG